MDFCKKIHIYCSVLLLKPLIAKITKIHYSDWQAHFLIKNISLNYFKPLH